jgi:hypothetical protein
VCMTTHSLIVATANLHVCISLNEKPLFCCCDRHFSILKALDGSKREERVKRDSLNEIMDYGIASNSHKTCMGSHGSHGEVSACVQSLLS